MIEEVEELGAELQPQTVGEFRVFGDGEIYVPETWDQRSRFCQVPNVPSAGWKKAAPFR